MRISAPILTGILVAALLIPVAGLTAAGRADCVEGSGVPHQESRVVKPFTRVAVSGVFEVRLTVGPAQQVVIRGDDNILPHIRSEVRDGTLTVDSDRSICIKTDLRLEIEVPELAGFQSDGTVALNARGIRGKTFQLKLDGSGSATLVGRCDRFEAALLGTGDIQAEALEARHVSIRLEGAGDATVFAAQRLDAAISGAGTVTYAGHPAQVNPDISGLGELIPR